MSAVYASARATEEKRARAEATLRDDDALMARRHAAQRTLATTKPPPVRSRLLAPAPASGAAPLGCGAVVLAMPAAGLWIVAATAGGGESSISGHAALVLAAFAAVLTAAAAAMFAATAVSVGRRKTVRAGRPTADAIWQRAWWCQRCEVVHFAAGDEPRGVGRGQVLDPSGFRAVVWTAGGYGDRLRR